ncbi:hypothetical protein [Euzebya tangerina]|uniref:hypothetical protein n=1 Tax=Euzebya tangerina TaxID=591198 RepID=UPI000E322913|nr:hypothetical protein [Euzebya tangerina]
MTIDQLRMLVEEAAKDLVARTERPHPVTVVLPLEESTKVVALEGFPDEDGARKDALSVLAARQMVPANAACFGFLAEADGPDGQDLLVVVYGARQRGAFLTAAVLDEPAGLGDFAEPEELEPSAMPFLQPLQHAADTAAPPTDAGPGLPIVSG